ncbi:XRE family transcriptional regulator [Staphylococcus microti]|uniref:Transcriptional regulator n=1 Tax=Staphylococcus microti TaxID=569857 RepID=A0A0D6XT60_9STAP|nr:XRE family transcriptional regulator [Staphylococcus microti]KIX91797.1 XRE family transcriptional regulator [Staphylococcus microti]PNZ84435.1 XRE family transcriptional regulator [Staphylococcus microti]SUM58367.1 transcriptional regulator [Staphylococcus microti]
MNFFENVRKKRLEKGYSLEVLSEKSGVSRAMLSKIERNEKQPTIKVAAQIAEGLDTTISELLGEKQVERAIQIKSGEHLKYTDPISGFERMLLSPNIGSDLEFIINKLPAQSKTGVFPAHAVGVKEYIYVLKGTTIIELTSNGDSQKYHLQAGDSFYFEAHKDHQFINDEDEICEYILIIDSTKSNRK